MGISDVVSQLPFCGAGLLLLSSALKLLDIANSREDQYSNDSRIISISQRTPFLLALIVVETTVSIAVFLSATINSIRLIALIAQSVIYSAFSLWTLYLLRKKYNSCRCFGSFSPKTITSFTVFRNSFFAITSIWGYYQAQEISFLGLGLIIISFGLIYTAEIR